MDVRVKATEYNMTPEISAYLDERLAHIGKLLGSGEAATRCEVELGRAGGHHRRSEYQWFAEIQVMRPGFAPVVARNTEPTMNAAIDRAKDEALRQLRKEKTVRTRKTRKEEGEAKRMLLDGS